MPSDELVPCDVIHSIQFNSAWGILSCMKVRKAQTGYRYHSQNCKHWLYRLIFISFCSATFSSRTTTISINILKFKELSDCSFYNLVLKSAEYLGNYRTIFILPHPLEIITRPLRSLFICNCLCRKIYINKNTLHYALRMTANNSN